jgi:hypothetical protein
MLAIGTCACESGGFTVWRPNVTLDFLLVTLVTFLATKEVLDTVSELTQEGKFDDFGDNVRGLDGRRVEVWSGGTGKQSCFLCCGRRLLSPKVRRRQTMMRRMCGEKALSV